jgi:hypothetical protein
VNDRGFAATWRAMRLCVWCVFLGHLSSHYVPGRNLTWYVVFVLSLATYLVALDRGRARSAA